MRALARSSFIACSLLGEEGRHLALPVHCVLQLFRVKRRCIESAERVRGEGNYANELLRGELMSGPRFGKAQDMPCREMHFLLHAETSDE